MPHRLASVVYVDSGPALDGVAYLDTLRPEVREVITLRHVREEGGGRLLPMPTWEELEQVNHTSPTGIDQPTQAAIRQRATPQPFGTYTQAISLMNPERTTRPHTLIACTYRLDDVRAMIASGHPWFTELAGPQWSMVELPTSHWPMFSAPAELADTLHGISDNDEERPLGSPRVVP